MKQVCGEIKLGVDTWGLLYFLVLSMFGKFNNKKTKKYGSQVIQ